MFSLPGGLGDYSWQMNWTGVTPASGRGMRDAAAGIQHVAGSFAPARYALSAI
jgi:hypothetical protein